MKNVKLEFYNADANPPVQRLNVSRDSVEVIMVWYGGFYAGDDYAVMIDGVEVPKDLNGEYEHDTIEHVMGRKAVGA